MPNSEFRCWECGQMFPRTEHWVMYWGGYVCGECYSTEMARLKGLVARGLIPSEEFDERVLRAPHSMDVEIVDA